MSGEWTSVSFGGVDVVEVALPLDEVRQLVQEAWRRGGLLELEARNGERMILNPLQVKLIQRLDGTP